MTGSIAIRCPISTVFGFLSRIETLPAWDFAVLQIERHSDGLVGVGMSFAATIDLPGGAMRSLSMVIAYEPPYQFGWLSEFGSERESTRITLEAAGDATIMHLRRHLTGHSSGAEYDAAGRARLEASLRRLRELLESDRAAFPI